MVARLRCLLAGELPAAVDPLKAERSGIDGTLSSVAEAGPHAGIVNVAHTENLRNEIGNGLTRAIQKMIAADSEEALLVLEGWDGSNLEAINYGLMDGARTLPAPGTVFVRPAGV